MEDHSECQCWLGLRVDHSAEDCVQERRRLMLCQANNLCQAFRTRCCHCSVGISRPPKRVGRESKQSQNESSSYTLSVGCLPVCLRFFYIDLYELLKMGSLKD